MMLSLRHTALLMMSASIIALTTGCGYLHKPETTMQYSPSDGIRTDLGDTKFRNLLVVSEDASAPGRLLGTILNDGSSETKVVFNAEKIKTFEITIPAGGSVNLQEENNKKLLEPTVGAQPGSMIKMGISNGTASADVNIPLMDGTLEEYRKYLPTHNKPIPVKGISPDESTANPSASPLAAETISPKPSPAH